MDNTINSLVSQTMATGGSTDKLTNQLLDQWDKIGVKDLPGGISLQDRASSLASTMAQNGITDLSNLKLGSKNISVDEEGGTAPVGYLTNNGQQLGFIGNVNENLKNKADYLQPNNLMSWTSEGHGNVGYSAVQTADGGVAIVPQWNSSSDMGQIRNAAKMIAAMYGGAALGAGAGAGSALDAGMGVYGTGGSTLGSLGALGGVADMSGLADITAANSTLGGAAAGGATLGGVADMSGLGDLTAANSGLGATAAGAATLGGVADMSGLGDLTAATGGAALGSTLGGAGGSLLGSAVGTGAGSLLGGGLGTALGVSSLANLAGGLLGANAATSAADKQAEAAKYAADLQKQMFDLQNAQQLPYRSAGYNALNQIQGMLPGQYTQYDASGKPIGTSTGTDYLTHQFNASDFANNIDPGYAFRLQQGQMANQRMANKAGGLLGANAQQGMQDYTQGLASQEYGNAFNRYTGNQTNIYNRLASLAGIGQTGQTQTNQMAQTAATNMGNLAVGSAGAQAAGGIGAANAYGNALGGIGNNFMLAQLLGQKQSIG